MKSLHVKEYLLFLFVLLTLSLIKTPIRHNTTHPNTTTAAIHLQL